MPLTPAFEWEESETLLSVTVRTPGVPRARVDVFATECLLKVNAPPYFFLADLHGEIDDAQTTATVDVGGVTFRAVKRSPGLWGRLTAEGATKEDLAQRRAASIEAAHRRIEEARRLKLGERKRYEKDLTHQTFDLDSAKRREVDRLKALELEAERRRVGLLPSGAEGDEDDEEEDEEEGAGVMEEEDAPMLDHPDYHGRGWRGTGQGRGEGEGESWSRRHVVVEGGEGEEDEEGQRGKGIPAQREGAVGSDGRTEAAAPPVTFRPLPPPRARAEAVAVEFTQLQTPHLPAREKREAEIAEYRRKAAEGGASEPSNDISERQPMFLKDKGDALFGKGNYQAALNAYSRAMELDDSIAALFANRAACHLQLGMLQQCAADCDRALALAPPPAGPPMPDDGEGGAEARAAAKSRRMAVKVLCRRAQARAQSGDAEGALVDLERALALDPGNEEIRRSAEDAAMARGTQDLSSVMEVGLRRFRAGDWEGAADAYGVAAEAARGSGVDEAAALVARAAALLKLNALRRAEEDCTQALGALVGAARAEGLERAHDSGTDGEFGDAAAALVAMGAPGSWDSGSSAGASLAKAVLRRAQARSHMRRFEDAARDFATLGEVYAAWGEQDKARAAEADRQRMLAMADPHAGALPGTGTGSAAVDPLAGMD